MAQWVVENLLSLVGAFADGDGAIPRFAEGACAPTAYGADLRAAKSENHGVSVQALR